MSTCKETEIIAEAVPLSVPVVRYALLVNVFSPVLRKRPIAAVSVSICKLTGLTAVNAARYALGDRSVPRELALSPVSKERQTAAAAVSLSSPIDPIVENVECAAQGVRSAKTAPAWFHACKGNSTAKASV